MVRVLAVAFFSYPAIGADDPSVNSGTWRHYGADLAGTRFASSVDINVENIGDLKPAWTYRTGDSTNGDRYFGRPSSFKATPIYFDKKLIFSTGFNNVHAIDPVSGQRIWVFDPEVNFRVHYAEMFSSRGVAAWENSTTLDAPCSKRIFLATLDARLIAINATNGEICTNFGTNGQIKLFADVMNYRKGQYSVTSPPIVVNNTIIVGSSVGDNGATDLGSGIVRAFDANTGDQLWEWDPIPRSTNRPETNTWENTSWEKTGGANVWSAMSADAQLNLVYLPTTSPSPDFFGGKRLGDNAWSNSIVALDITSGDLEWAYQTIKHDLWDYDLAAQPLLVDIEINGEQVPIIVQAGKTGFLHVLNRATGNSIYPMEQKRVPSSDVPGERAAETQAFPAIRLHPEPKTIPALYAYSPDHVDACTRMLENVRFEGIFTPPSLAGTLLYPGNPGGINWGSMSFQQGGSLAFTVVNRFPTVVQLLPRREYRRQRRAESHKDTDAQYTSQSGTPFGMVRFDLYRSYPQGNVPCLEGPWSTLVAIDLAEGKVKWEVPAGIAPGVPANGEAATWGSPVNYGGSIITEGGVLFLATREDRMLHAYDAKSGTEIWHEPLPAQPSATPMAYTHENESYVVVAAGGKSDSNNPGDYLVSFKLELVN